MTSRWVIGGAILVGLSGWSAFFDFVWDDRQRVESKQAIIAKAAIPKQHAPFVETCYDRFFEAISNDNPKKRQALKVARTCGCWAKEQRKFGTVVRPSIKNGLISALTKVNVQATKKKDRQSKRSIGKSIWNAFDEELANAQKTIALNAVEHILSVCFKKYGS